MVKIGYDAGHGINTPGKRTPDDEREWKFNDVIAKAFAKELSLYENVELKRFDDSTGKTDTPLNTRTSNATKWGVDYYISFHHNANTSKWGTWTGVETFVYDTPSTIQNELAKAIHPSLVKGYGLRDRGIKKGNLAICRDIKNKKGVRVGVLVEGGFMDSTIDIKKLRDNKVLENTGKLIAESLAKYLKLKKKTVAKPTETPTIKPTVKPTEKPTEAPKKQEEKKVFKTLVLPKTASSWNVYPLNKQPVSKNAIGQLNPKKFGGLQYEILGNPQKDVYTIKTSNFGKVNIYAAKSTGATIK